MWRYAVAHGLVRSEADDEELELLTQRLTPGMAGYLVLVGVGLVLPLVAVVGYLVIALVLLLPIGLRTDSQRRNGEVTGEHP